MPGKVPTYRDESGGQCCSRIVVRVMEQGEEEHPEELSPSAVFSAMPPMLVETLKILVFRWITDQDGKRGAPLELDTWDVSRAHFYREVHVREDRLGCSSQPHVAQGEGCWQDMEGELGEGIGKQCMRKDGRDCPALFRGERVCRLCDDFGMPGNRALRFEVRQTGSANQRPRWPSSPWQRG